MNFIPYEGSFGEANYPEGFFDTIKNLPIDEQVRFFALCGTTRFQIPAGGSAACKTTAPFARATGT